MGMMQQAQEAPVEEQAEPVQEAPEQEQAEPESETPEETQAEGGQEEPGEKHGMGGDEGASPNVSPELQKEYDRAFGAMMTLLYKNPQATQAIAAQLDEGEKIGSPARAALMIIKHINDKLHIDPGVAAQLTMDTADEVMQIGDKKGIAYSPHDAQLILGTVWEGVTHIFGEGSDLKDAMTQMTEGLSDQEIEKAGIAGKRMIETAPKQAGADNGPPLPDSLPNPAAQQGAAPQGAAPQQPVAPQAAPAGAV